MLVWLSRRGMYCMKNFCNHNLISIFFVILNKFIIGYAQCNNIHLIMDCKE